MEKKSLEIGEIAGVQIFVDSTGKFYADIEGKRVRRASLRAIEKYIEDNVAVPLPVIVVRYDEPVMTIDGIKGTTNDNLVGTERKYKSYDEIYLYDEAAAAKLQELSVQYQQLRKDWNTILKELKRVRSSNFEELRSQARHEGQGDAQS